MRAHPIEIAGALTPEERLAILRKVATAPNVVYWTLAAALFWLGLRWFERVQLYIPDTRLDVHPGSYGLPYETARFTAADGVRLHGWLIPGEADGAVVLLTHGNAGNISNRVEKARLLHRLGASVFLFDYRGYGESLGRPTELGLYRDAEAAYAWLRRRTGSDMIFYGESLGCGVAVELALRHPPRTLVLESPFTSVVDMARRVFPFLPASLLVRDRFDNLAKLPQVRAPLVILHSPDDEIVPFAMGRRLFEAAAAPKAFVELRGGHNDGFLQAGSDYTDAMASLLGARARS